jgi:N-acetylglucosaminyldiphosphoundecaprenol N-acetyl-beta-D-mannosaminyltransferase
MTGETTLTPRWLDALRNNRIRWLGFLLGAIALAVATSVMLRYVSFAEIGQAMRQLKPGWALVAVAGLVGGQLLRILRSARLLSRRIGSDGGAYRSNRIQQGVIGGQIINWLLPVRIGDAWRIWHIAAGKVAALVWTATSVVLEKSADALILSAMAFILLFLPLPAIIASPLSRLLTTALGGMLLLSAISALSSSTVRNRLIKRLPINPALRADALTLPLAKPRELISAFAETVAFSAVIWGLAIVTNVALARGFDIHIGLAGHILLLLAFQTSMVFSPIPGNIGLFALVAATVFLPLGISQTTTIAFGSALWLLVYGTLSCIGLTLLLAALTRRRHSTQTETHLLGTRISLLTLPQVLQHMTAQFQAPRRAIYAYANAHALNLAYTDKDLRHFFNVTADVVFCDGFGAKWGARLAGCPEPPERFTPPDWIDQLCEQCCAQDLSVALVGGQPGVAARAAQQLVRRHPTLHIAHVSDGFFEKDKTGTANQQLVNTINQSGANVLLVGMGMPMQEYWLQENWPELRPQLAITVGMLFSYISGDAQRAPRWMTANGLEWLGRLAFEPRRLWKRYVLGNPQFLLRALKQRFANDHANAN